MQCGCLYSAAGAGFGRRTRGGICLPELLRMIHGSDAIIRLRVCRCRPVRPQMRCCLALLVCHGKLAAGDPSCFALSPGLPTYHVLAGFQYLEDFWRRAMSLGRQCRAQVNPKKLMATRLTCSLYFSVQCCAEQTFRATLLSFKIVYHIPSLLYTVTTSDVGRGTCRSHNSPSCVASWKNDLKVRLLAYALLRWHWQ